MTTLFNEADENLLRALPNETRRAVVELAGRAYKQGIADAAECIRTEGSGPQYGPTLSGIYRGIASALTGAAETMPTFDLGDIPTPDPTTLSDAEILDLPPLDRTKVLADLAKTGHHLIAAIIDVGIPCTNEMCLDGRVRISGDVVVDCHVCDGVGSIDGRRRCADRECLSYGEPLAYSLGGGWECSRKHGHAERERVADVHIAPDEVARFSVTIAHDGIVADVTDYAAVPFAEEARFVTPADLADVVNVDPAPAADPDAFPWDAPSPDSAAPIIEPDEDAGSYLTAPCNLDGSLSIAERFGLE